LFTFLPDDLHGRPVSHGPQKPKVMGALQLRGLRFKRRKAGPIFAELFGCAELPEGTTLAISGVPSSGKSTLAVAMAEDGTYSSPLVVCGEEGLSVGVADRISRVEAVRSRFTDARNLAELAEVLGDDPSECDVDLVILDSLTSLGATASDVAQLVAVYPVSVMAVVQSRRDGSFRGSQQLMHEFAAWIDLAKDGRYEVQKSWWGALRSGVVPGREQEEAA
jgi:predicted ATP-dependent serine protease